MTRKAMGKIHGQMAADQRVAQQPARQPDGHRALEDVAERGQYAHAQAGGAEGVRAAGAAAADLGQVFTLEQAHVEVAKGHGAAQVADQAGQ